MILTVDQQKIISELKNRILGNLYQQSISTVGGYAGTGKTTLICELRRQLRIRPFLSVAFLTFTGKASSVLKNKLTEHKALYSNDFIGTIHSLIYKPITRWDKQLKTFIIMGWELKDEDEIWPDLFIIDEASMISREIWMDLLKYGKPIVAVGDHGQLPPIGDKFNLMQNPDFKLIKIHRQALNSPIISLSKFVREEGYIPYKIFSPKVLKLKWDHPWCKKIWDERINFKDDLVILCGFNTTRANLNDIIRTKMGYTELLPYPGEKVVCLKNNHHADIMNGQIGEVVWIMPEEKGLWRMTLNINSDVYEILTSKKCFGEVQYTMFDKPNLRNEIEKYASQKGYHTVSYFDYGYVISVHKSQGAEWNFVVLFEQRSKHWDDNYYARWLYTAITRAKEKLLVIGNAWI